MTQVKGIELVVDGIQFIQEPPTFEQEMYILQQVTEAGLDQPHVTLKLDPENPQDLERSVRLLIVEAYKSGTLWKLLGSMVVQKDTEWTEEQAARNAQIFRKTRDPKGKAQLYPALAHAIIAFFESAGSVEKISPISSDETEADSRLVSVRPKTDPKIAEALFNSGTTPAPSERSPSTKVSRSKKSSRGRSVKA